MMNEMRLMVMSAIMGSWLLVGGVGCRTTEAVKKTTEPRGKSEAPAVGDKAPLFTLKMLDEDKKVSLASFRGKRPVALFFGSYT